MPSLPTYRKCSYPESRHSKMHLCFQLYQIKVIFQHILNTKHKLNTCSFFILLLLLLCYEINNGQLTYCQQQPMSMMFP